MERVSLDISSKEKLSEIVRSPPVLYGKSRHGFKEKDALKKAWDGVTTATEFNLAVYYFYFLYFFKIVLFIWLNPLVPGVFPIYTLSTCLSLCRTSRSQMFFKVFLKILQY